jgi:hypothetical protein
VTFSSDAALVKLKCRAAASKARNPLSEGNLAVMSHHSMSLCHVTRDKVSFVEVAWKADIAVQRLTLGGDHVHLHPRIDE